jgi:hypothetical protein
MAEEDKPENQGENLGDSTAAGPAEENRRKLQEHLEKLKRFGGKPPKEEPPDPAQAQDAPRTGGKGEEPPIPEPPRMDPRRKEKWEAFKRLHGHRIHEIRPEEIAQPADQADYRMLGISPKASLEEVRQAFNRLAKLHHPDHGGDPQKFHDVRVAYERIKRR